MSLSQFRNQIRTALADQDLQAALDNNTALREKGTVYRSLPEKLAITRQRTHKMRANLVAHLDTYLEQFIDNCQNNGISVHLAENADEATRICQDIAKKHDACLVAKSKSMVTEEVGLNAALEEIGIEVVETDLGEFIIQLRGESPSHIIAPAIHLCREQVGDTFHDKLGIPRTVDIPTLTNAARKTLRQTFLNADIGISGVNFGVAENGTLCIVTNEGNGRMVTTLPPVHIALMGMERIVPTNDDLNLVLSLLARSATGQKLSVYTQLIRAPKTGDEVDGAQERHLILIDNGRSKMRGSPLNDALMCIRCGACLNACPVFGEIGGHSYLGKNGKLTPYSGPIGSVISPALFGQGKFGHLAQASSLCGACKDACPVDIDLPSMLLRIRANLVPEVKTKPEKIRPAGLPFSVNWALRMFTWIATRPRRFGLAQKLGAIFSRMVSPNKDWMKLPPQTGWGYSKDFPRPVVKTFHERWEDISDGARAEGRREAGGKGVRARELGVGDNDNKGKDDQVDLATRFAEELTALNGSFTACSSTELPERLLAFLRERKIDQILAWNGEYLPSGLADQLREGNVNLFDGSTPEFPRGAWSSIKAGLTGAAAAISETGTLVVASGSGRPQAVSLLPELHIAIIHERDIYANLPQVLKLQEVRDASSVSLISGPSRTGDIEMTLTIGVHGPGEVQVFCIRD